MMRIRGVLVLLAAASLAIVGCSSSKKTSSSTGATTPSGGGSSSSGGTNANELRTLQAAVQNNKTATFKATYTSTQSGGSQQTVTFEQKPPKSLFSSGDGLLVNDGTTTYYCSGSSGSQTCLAAGTGSSNPMAGLLGLYNGDTMLPLFQQWQTQLAAKVAGFNVTFTDQTFGGQASKCATWSYQGQSAKYCVTNSGLIAYYGGSTSSGGGSFQLSSYTTDVPDSDFKLPAGATTETLPNGITVPSVP